MNKTSIDWPGLAYSWNPIVGCKHGCPYCYARKIMNRFYGKGSFETPRFFPDRINQPLKVKKPSMVFVGSMCDIFSPGVEWKWIENIIKVAAEAAWHQFMFLTKKPEGYREYKWPSNCWLGTTVDGCGNFHRMDELRHHPNHTFISIEPILSPFHISIPDSIDLVIIGADSSRGAKVPPLEWVKSIQHHNIHYKTNILRFYPELKNNKP